MEIIMADTDLQADSARENTCVGNPAWEKAKAEFAGATSRYNKACQADDRIGMAQSAWCAANPAPERRITYSEEGWTIDRPTMHVEVKPRAGLEFVLNSVNVHRAPDAVTSTAEFAEFMADLNGWEARRDAHGEANNWSAASEEWDDAANAHIAAWRALVACPVATATHLAEKVELASPDLCASEDEIELFTSSIRADLARIVSRV
jgi:hypothetical protein